MSVEKGRNVGTVVVVESSKFLDEGLEGCRDRHRAEEQANIRGTPQHQLTPVPYVRSYKPYHSLYHHRSTGQRGEFCDTVSIGPRMLIG